MHCKFCGNRIDSSSTKCMSCGANIDFNDGGQSFFDDNELDSWQSDSIVQGPVTSMPKTEILENEQPENTKIVEKYPSRRSQRSSGSRTGRKKKKNGLDILNLSSANKLIIFCIASAVAIVLLVAAIVSVITGRKDDGTENNSSSVNQTTASDNVQSGVQEQNAVGAEQVQSSRTEILNIKIIKCSEEVPHPVPAYMIDEKLYISLDQILAHEKYKARQSEENSKNRVYYEHSQTGKRIGVEIGTANIWLNEKDEDNPPLVLDGNSFYENNEIYVRAESFYIKEGYNNVTYDKDNNILNIEL